MAADGSEPTAEGPRTIVAADGSEPTAEGPRTAIGLMSRGPVGGGRSRPPLPDHRESCGIGDGPPLPELRERHSHHRQQEQRCQPQEAGGSLSGTDGISVPGGAQEADVERGVRVLMQDIPHLPFKEERTILVTI